MVASKQQRVKGLWQRKLEGGGKSGNAFKGRLEVRGQGWSGIWGKNRKQEICTNKKEHWK